MTRKLSLDIATFSGYYRHLQTNEPGIPFFTPVPAPPHLVSPLVFNSKASAHTYGIEAFTNWNVTRRWRISPGYSAIHTDVNLDPTSGDTNTTERAYNTPQHQIQIRSLLNLTRRLDWDSTLYHVGGLRDGGDGAVPSYNRVDTRLAWRAGETIEFTIIGQNLLVPKHAEFHNAYEVRRTLVERSVFGKIAWRF